MDRADRRNADSIDAMNPDPPGSLDAFIQALPEDGDPPAHRGRAALPRAAEDARPGRLPGRPRIPPEVLPVPLVPGVRADAPAPRAAVVHLARSATTRRPGSIFAGHVRQNVRYVETSFHLHVTEFIHVPGPGDHRRDPVGGAPRPRGARVRGHAPQRLRRPPARRDRRDARLGGPGRASTCTASSRCRREPWAFGVWERMRKAGKVTKCHAGEFDGPARVREAIQQLGVRRVQHGVRAVEDPAVVRLAADLGVTFDICPLSNVAASRRPGHRVASDPPADAGGGRLHRQHGRPALLRQHPQRGVRGARGRGRIHARRAGPASPATAGPWPTSRRPTAGAHGSPRSTGWRRRERAAQRLSIADGVRRVRADKALASAFPEHSRVAFQRAFDAGLVALRGRPIERSATVRAGDVLEFSFPEVKAGRAQGRRHPPRHPLRGQVAPRVDKPAGMVVHPGAGTREDTLVHALLAHCAGSLSGIGGVARPGIVHRLDRETSGADHRRKDGRGAPRSREAVRGARGGEGVPGARLRRPAPHERD